MADLLSSRSYSGSVYVNIDRCPVSGSIGRGSGRDGINWCFNPNSECPHRLMTIIGLRHAIFGSYYIRKLI